MSCFFFTIEKKKKKKIKLGSFSSFFLRGEVSVIYCNGVLLQHVMAAVVPFLTCFSHSL